MTEKIKTIFGRKSGKGAGGGSTSESPNTLQSRSTARLVEIVSHGECVGLADPVHPLRSIFMDGVPVENSDGSSNFTGITIEQRVGLPNQDPFTGFSETDNETSVGLSITVPNPRTYTVTNNNIDAVRLRVQIDALTQQDQTSGGITGSLVSFKISSRVGVGAYTDILTETLNEKCTTPQQLSYRIERPDAASETDDWSVKVTRLTADSVTVLTQNSITLAAVTEITDSKLQYADLAGIAGVYDSQQFGSSIPVRSVDWVGLVLDVPSNYTPPDYADALNPADRQYTGLWDGTFKRAWTDNPAWILWAMLTDKDWGLGRSINAQQIDKWSLYQIAQYCDEFVDDGYGGTEPRYRINTQVTQAEDAYAMLQSIASVFRGMLYWGTGTATFVADQPKDPVKLVSPANVIDGDFTYTGAALKARHSVALVTWNDPTDQYQQAIEVVEDAEQIDRFGWRTASVAAYGCTSRGQANRMGRWILDSERYESEMVTYQASFDHADVRPGQIINLYDPNYAGLRMAGRLTAITGTSATVDSPVTIDGAQTYTLTMLRPDGSLINRTLTNSPGSTSVLTWASTVSSLPAASSSVTIFAIKPDAPVQRQQIRAVTVTTVTFEQAVILLDGATYAITFTLPDGSTLARTITTTISTGHQLGTSSYYEHLTLAWTSSLGATLPATGSTAFVAVPGEGFIVRSVTSCTSTTVTLSSPYTFDAQYQYNAVLTLPDGSTQQRLLTTLDSTTPGWDGPLDDLPLVGSMWGLTATNLAPRQFRVINVRESAPNVFEVNALEYDANKYVRIEEGLVLPTVVTSVYTSQEQPGAATNIVAVRNLVVHADGTVDDVVRVYWTISESNLVNRYQFSYKFASNQWVDLPEVYAAEAEFKSQGPGLYTFRIIAITFLGKQSAAAEVAYDLEDVRPFDGATITNIHIET